MYKVDKKSMAIHSKKRFFTIYINVYYINLAADEKKRIHDTNWILSSYLADCILYNTFLGLIKISRTATAEYKMALYMIKSIRLPLMEPIKKIKELMNNNRNH